MSSWTHERARVASLTRSRQADDPELVEARKRLKAAWLADHVERALADAPPLSPEACARIARLLTPAGGGGDA